MSSHQPTNQTKIDANGKIQQNPRVSILLPNLNNCKYLKDRFDSILAQTFSDWELIVVDGYSDDNSWELIQRYAQNDSRIQTFQYPRQGIYNAINDCIRLAKGEYIYIATSDDTMMPDCLQKMIAALDQFPSCDLCHCCLQIIDEQGHPKEGEWESLLPAKFYSNWLRQPHIRQAPIDAVLYCCLNTVYSSLTQLLIRRKVFDDVGYFKNQYGSQGDFEWGIRATLICNTFHWPEYLATWRRHPSQASQDSLVDSAKGRKVLVSIIEDILSDLPNAFRIPTHSLTYCYRFESLQFLVREKKTLSRKLLAILINFRSEPSLTIRYILDQLGVLSFDRIKYAQKLLKMQGIEHHYIRSCS